MLCIKNLHFSYGSKKILKGLTFSLEKGEIAVLIGLSGSGKTTLFRLINGLIQPEQGKIVFENSENKITYMRQEDLLLPWRTALSNLLLFTELGKRKRDAGVIEEAYVLFKRMGLEGYEEAYPSQLSEGMRQRLSLARALLQNHPFILLDEPFASLDVIIREELYDLLREIRVDTQKTMMMVTHDFRDAMALGDRILVLSQGEIAADYLLTAQIKEDPVAVSKLIQQIRALLSGRATP
ncbi:MAG: ABC transporter ATP-binding protein [Chlamydiales bacterium]